MVSVGCPASQLLLNAKRNIDRRDMRMAQLQLFHGIRGRERLSVSPTTTDKIRRTTMPSPYFIALRKVIKLKQEPQPNLSIRRTL